MENLAKIGRWFYAMSLVGLARQQFYYGSFRPVFGIEHFLYADGVQNLVPSVWPMRGQAAQAPVAS
jgi:hypothetical protein